MVFSSMLFVFLFFVANIITQALVPDMKKKNIVMLSFSLVFYAWAGIRYVPLLLGMTFICWYFARQIANTKRTGTRKTLLTVCIVLVLAILGFFKYTGFFLKNVQLLTGFPKVIPQIVLPIGISFYTFQLLSYVVDVYRGDAQVQEKYWLLLLYASLFHQCIAGPIVRYRDVNEDILHRRPRLAEISRGVTRFAIGLAKKALLANWCASLFLRFLNVESEGALTLEALKAVPVAGVWMAMICYMLQIYLDFSAYSDMAIGMGLMCGFHYKENFNYPYVANSITDFWRRWHMSLSSFFRDYVYIPLGGNRCSKGRHIFNMFVVWALTGMWHGASWNYIFWGLYFFVFLVAEKYLFQVDRIPTVLRHVLVLLAVLFGWVLFKFENLGMMFTALGGMFGLNGNAFTSYETGLCFTNNVVFLFFAILAVTPVGMYLNNLMKNASRGSLLGVRLYGAWDVICPVLLVFLSAMALAGNTYNPFLYFQF